MGRKHSWIGEAWAPWWLLGLVHRWRVVHVWEPEGPPEPVMQGRGREVVAAGYAWWHGTATVRMFAALAQASGGLPPVSTWHWRTGAE
jgi:hypothetical protein